MNIADTRELLHKQSKFRRSSKEHAKAFFDDLREYLSEHTKKMVKINQEDTVAIELNMTDKGLTYAEKAQLFSSPEYKMQAKLKCRCYSAGNKCKLHAINYTITDTIYEVV